MTKRKGLAITAVSTAVLGAVLYFAGAQMFFYGTYLLQDSTVHWNGLTIPIQRPIAVAPGRDDQQLLLKSFKDDWTGVTDTFAMRNVYDVESVRIAAAYCSQVSKDCEQGQMPIAGIPFRYVAFGGDLQSVGGDFHVKMWSESPAITIDYHGEKKNYPAFQKLLANIRRP